MPTIEYPLSHPYRPLEDAPALAPVAPVVLHFAGRQVRTVAILDSGAAITVFKNEMATLLGIANIEDGA